MVGVVCGKWATPQRPPYETGADLPQFPFPGCFFKTARKRKPIISVKEGALFWVCFLKNSAKTEKPWLNAKAFEIVHAVRLT
ncbi:hypothetical protein FHS90_002145 [Rufibacter quisquiliarum]|uniref:Uncharacterized protein n=1 Tax=Rufibacter quisquiliarum TaxID=1549639 RepID=A0A839GEU5_9BACT|nr:hypothetical protein [Rufibacter quisquiliarum]